MVNYIGQIFGNREIIKNECDDEDWKKLGIKVPNITSNYVLTRCGNCGFVLPASIKNLRQNPPKRCVMCSNIGNHSNVITNTNSWATYEKDAVCNIIYQGKVVSFYIDIDDYEKVSSYVWRIAKKRNKYYAITGSYKKGTAIYVHEMVHGKPEKPLEIDHIDGNSLNNRKNNLRSITHLQNIDNQRATRIDNSIGIKGISIDKRSNLYQVDCSYHGKRYYMKPWKTLQQAVWCRYCFEDYFNLQSIKNNPLAEQYFTLSENEKEEINQYVLNKILGNKR